MKHQSLGLLLNTDKKLVLKETKTDRILEIRVQGPELSKKAARPRLNLALVIDRSGSMAGEKLEYVKQAACHVLDLLNEQDQVSLVIFDDEIQVLARSTKITNGNRFELQQRISRIQSSSSTNLCDGWLTGCKEIASSAEEGMINRTLLLTDGQANVGQTDPEILAGHAFALYKDTIATSTFGVGLGFNEQLLEAMANRGGGNFYYIENPRSIPEIFATEFNKLVGIAARKVEIKLEIPSGIDWKVLASWSHELKDGHLHIYMGDMLAGKLRDIYVKLVIPADEHSTDISLGVTAFGRSEDGNLLEAQDKATFQYANQKDVETELVNQEVMERFSVVDMADEANEAAKLEREGKRREAAQRVQSSLNRNRPYVSTQDSVKYENLSGKLGTGMTEADRKQTHWDSYQTKRQKGMEDQEEKH